MKSLLLMSIILAVSGCATMSSRMAEVRAGMTKVEVEKVLGKPRSAKVIDQEHSAYEYSLLESGLGFNQTYFVVFENDKVMSSGRAHEYGPEVTGVQRAALTEEQKNQIIGVMIGNMVRPQVNCTTQRFGTTTTTNCY